MANPNLVNVTSITGESGAVIVDWNMVMTMALLATGIILNVARIIEIRRRDKKD